MHSAVHLQRSHPSSVQRHDLPLRLASQLRSVLPASGNHRNIISRQSFDVAAWASARRPAVGQQNCRQGEVSLDNFNGKPLYRHQYGRGPNRYFNMAIGVV